MAKKKNLYLEENFKVKAEEAVKIVKRYRRAVVKILKSYREKKFGKGTNEFGMKYSTNYLEGIVQALELSLVHLGYKKQYLNSKRNLDLFISELEKQSIE